MKLYIPFIRYDYFCGIGTKTSFLQNEAIQERPELKQLD